MIQSRPAFHIGIEPRLGDHAAIPDQHDPAEAEAAAQLADLGGQRHRVGDIAFKDLDGDRASLLAAQQAIDDLRAVRPVIAAVAALGQFTALAFEIAGADIVEHQDAVLEMAAGQGLLDAGLGGLQPVHRLVEFVGIDFAQPQQRPQRVGGGGVAELARGGKLGGGLDDAGDDQGENELGPALRPSGQDLVKAYPAQRAERGGHMPARERALDLERLPGRRPHRLVGEHPAQGVDLGFGPLGQVGKGAGLDLALLAVALAQEHGRRRVPVGDDGDVHADMDS